MAKVKRLHSRYFCPENHRVFPYDGFESLTEGPVQGKKGPVLLYSLNSSIHDGKKHAWCFSCDEWVMAYRRTQHEIMMDYLARTNVSLRAGGGRRQQALALAQRIEERRNQK